MMILTVKIKILIRKSQKLIKISKIKNLKISNNLQKNKIIMINNKINFNKLIKYYIVKINKYKK